MSPELLARLTREAEAPEGIAVRVSGPEMKRLLEERRMLLWALDKIGRQTSGDCEYQGMASWLRDVARDALRKSELP